MRVLALSAAASLLAAGAAIAFAGPIERRPTSAERAETACFRADRVISTRVGEDGKVRVSVEGEIWELTPRASCQALTSSMVARVTPWPGSDFVCTGFAADLWTPTAGRRDRRCPVGEVRRLTDAEIAATPRVDLP